MREGERCRSHLLSNFFTVLISGTSELRSSAFVKNRCSSNCSALQRRSTSISRHLQVAKLAACLALSGGLLVEEIQ